MRGSVKIAVALALLAGTAVGGAALAQKKAPAKVAPLPKGQILVGMPDAFTPSITDFYYPFGATDHTLIPFDLAANGYTETETILTGKANVYDWGPDGKIVVKTPDVPYGTRILLRMPKDKSKFSGVVVVEVPNEARGWDWDMMWGYLKEAIMRRGDAYMDITLPKSTLGLKKFDSNRYSDLNAKPLTALACQTKENGDVIEEGLRFDFIAQAGALLKSNDPKSPMAGYNVKRLFMTGQAGGGSDLSTYAIAMQKTVRMPGDKPIYDGYLFKNLGGLGRINHCAPTPAADDARSKMGNWGVPVVAVVAQADWASTSRLRRADSDTKDDPFRDYEIAGSGHLDRYAYGIFPSLDDQKKGGNQQGTVQWPFTARCTPEQQLSTNPLYKYSFDAALENLANWSLNGVAPPRVAPMPTTADGKDVVVDKYGIAAGGVRSPWSDAPNMVSVLHGKGPGNCPELSYDVDFSWPYLVSLYGTPEARQAKALASVDAMVANKTLTAFDADLVRADIKAGPKAPALGPLPEKY